MGVCKKGIIGGIVEQQTLPLEQRRYRFDVFTAHCAGIIRIEIERRKLSARHLLDQKVINHRNNFKHRLKHGEWTADEFRSLIEYLRIDMVRVMTSFLSADPRGAHDNGVYDNFTGFITALIQEYDRDGTDKLPTMEPMREGVLGTLAKPVLEQVYFHNELVTKARDTSPPAQAITNRISARCDA
jgi:hypothetical protein